MQTIEADVIEGGRDTPYETTTQLARRYEISPRTVQRDISLLKAMMFPEFKEFDREWLDPEQIRTLEEVRKLRGMGYKSGFLKKQLAQYAKSKRGQSNA